MIADFTISSESEDMDLEAIHAFLSQSYWAFGIPKTTLEKALSKSLCFGVFNRQGDQIGFARAVTDAATFAYLADVYILEEYRGLGLSKWLISEVVSHRDLQGLRRITLATRDAHGLYEQYGFKALANPETFMEAWNPSVYEDE
ncbi:MAG: GNAT family N-acetyltransferase [Halioglobus sp.]